jgi:hypothetical protein
MRVAGTSLSSTRFVIAQDNNRTVLHGRDLRNLPFFHVVPLTYSLPLMRRLPRCSNLKCLTALTQLGLDGLQGQHLLPVDCGDHG